MADQLKASVRSTFYDFNSKFEGVVNWMYLDVKGLVTTGVGNLIDPVRAALDLPFHLPDGQPASREDIEAEWRTIKNHQELARLGAGAAKSMCRLRLTPEDVRKLVDRRLTENVAQLVKRFPGFADWPAEAQMGVCSMAWAMGAGFHFPKFEAAVKRMDFATAALECEINATKNAGVIPRNHANKALFEAAASLVNLQHRAPDPEPVPAVTMAQEEPVTEQAVEPSPETLPEPQDALQHHAGEHGLASLVRELDGGDERCLGTHVADRSDLRLQEPLLPGDAGVPGLDGDDLLLGLLHGDVEVRHDAGATVPTEAAPHVTQAVPTQALGPDVRALRREEHLDEELHEPEHPVHLRGRAPETEAQDGLVREGELARGHDHAGHLVQDAVRYLSDEPVRGQDDHALGRDAVDRDLVHVPEVLPDHVHRDRRHARKDPDARELHDAGREDDLKIRGHTPRVHRAGA